MYTQHVKIITLQRIHLKNKILLSIPSNSILKKINFAKVGRCLSDPFMHICLDSYICMFLPMKIGSYL